MDKRLMKKKIMDPIKLAGKNNDTRYITVRVFASVCSSGIWYTIDIQWLYTKRIDYGHAHGEHEFHVRRPRALSTGSNVRRYIILYRVSK